MFRTTTLGSIVTVMALATFSVSCSTVSEADPGDTPTVASLPERSASPTEPATPPTPDTTPVEKVRDAFAGLQATLNESCTPGNCGYFLNRVHYELHRLDRAMKADDKGPSHFAEPIRLIEKLDTEVGSDESFENLKKHQTTLIATRDKINVWMQGHPDDYR
ncbi:hypothetical protein ACWEQC_11275 [Streptomyces shenzhenensis]